MMLWLMGSSSHGVSLTVKSATDGNFAYLMTMATCKVTANDTAFFNVGNSIVYFFFFDNKFNCLFGNMNEMHLYLYDQENELN